MDKFIANLTKLRSVFGECVLHAKSEEDNRWLVRWLVDQLCEDEMWSTTHMNEVVTAYENPTKSKEIG